MLGVGVLVDSRIFREWLQRSKLIELRHLYIIGKLLELRCLKWVSMIHLDIWNTSYGQKKDWESNWQFDSRPVKVRNRPDFLAHRWCATYRWKALNEGYYFVLNLISIGGLQRKLWAPKVARVPSLRISGLPLGNPKTKSHLDVAPVKRCRIYYKGEGDGFPQVWVVVSLVNPSCPRLILTPKVLQLCTNHLVLVLCRSVWVTEACQFFLIPSWSSNMPFLPFQSAASQGACPDSLLFRCFLFGTHIWIPQGVRSASPNVSN
jgi:hypothetical protein